MRSDLFWYLNNWGRILNIWTSDLSLNYKRPKLELEKIFRRLQKKKTWQVMKIIWNDHQSKQNPKNSLELIGLFPYRNDIHKLLVIVHESWLYILLLLLCQALWGGCGVLLQQLPNKKYLSGYLSKRIKGFWFRYVPHGKEKKRIYWLHKPKFISINWNKF